jgi:hypothetical protein
LLELTGARGEYILDSGMVESQAQTLLSNTLQREEQGYSAEQGIKATYRVLEKNLKGETPQHNRLIRDGAHFAALVISDEDESANEMRNDPHNLLKLISDNYVGKAFSFHSIITIPGDTACKSGHGYAYGNRYKTLSDLTGGVIGSVCENDYTPQVVGIANGIRDLLKTLTLECEPLAGKPLIVYKSGVPYSGAFSKDGVNLCFANELDAGDYSVEYSCTK